MAGEEKDRNVGRLWCFLISAAFMIVAALLIYVLVVVWPAGGEASSISKKLFWAQDLNLNADQHLLVLVLLSSALGGIGRSLLELSKRTSAGDLKWRNILSFVAFPVLGAILAMALYVVIRAGFVGFNDDQALNAYGYLAVALLSGMYAYLVAGRLKKVAESLFVEVGDSEGKPGDPAGKGDEQEQSAAGKGG